MKKQLLEDIVDSYIHDEIPEGWVELDFAKEIPNLEQEVIDDPEAVQRLLAATRFESMMEMVERREAAAKDPKPCPYCDSIQVQLTQWATPTLQFKCRTCKQKFVRTLK